MESDKVSSTASVPKSLLERVTGCTVGSYKVESGSSPGDNYMSVLYSVTAEVILDPSQNTKETRHYLLKCFPQHPSRQGYLRETNMFHRELLFYTVWAKELVAFQKEILPTNEKTILPAFPSCIGGEATDFSKTSSNKEPPVPDSFTNFIMMTDMKKAFEYKMVDRTIALDLDHMILVFKELATIHALSWAYQNKKSCNLLEKFPFLHSPFSRDDITMWTKIVSGNVDLAVKTLDVVLGKGNHLSESTLSVGGVIGKLVEFFLFQNEGMEKELWELHRNPPQDEVDAANQEEPWRIITHGDCWSNNFLFKYNASGRPEQTVMVDFQMSRSGCPSADWVYLMYTSATSEFRKAHLDTLFQVYYEMFLHVCQRLKTEPLPGFTLESIRRRFHGAKPIGFMMAISILPMKLNTEEKSTNLEELDKDANMDDMFSEAFRTGITGSLYKKWIFEIADELYKDGVI